MKYVGDFTPGKTVRLRFNTHQADGTPITLAGSPAVSVYKGSTTESTAGVTLTVSYDSRTGLNDVVIDTSADGTFYAAGSDFDVVITTGTVDGVSVVGTVVGTFSLSNRSALRPTTADRTLDVAGTGEAGLDFTNRLDTTGILPSVAAGANGGLPLQGGAIPNASANANGGLPILSSSGTTLGYTVTTVTTLSNLPAVTTDWLSAAGVSAGAATKIANAVEAEIIDETDSEKVLTAITDKIASVNPSLSGLTLAAIASAVRDVSNASPAANSLGAGVNAVKAKTDNLPADPAGLAGLASAHGAGSWATATGFSTHSAADVWGVGSRTLTAFGFTVSTNDVTLAAAQPNYAPSKAGDAMALTAGERTTLTAAIWAYVVEGAVTAVQILRGLASFCFGKVSGGNTTAPMFRDLGDTKNRIVMTTDANGNRTAVTRDLT